MKKNETVQEMNNALAELVAKAKAGDQNAFTELYDRTAQDLYRCIRAMTRDEDLAWDIQQDSYLRAYNSLDKLENNAAFFPWLRRIAVNVTATQMSQRRTLTFSELACDEEEDPFSELPDFNVDNQPELSLDRKETSRLVQEILSKLPEEQQLIVGMRYYDELSVKEIADTLHLSTGAVKAQLFHGRKKVEAAVRALEKKGVKLYGLSPMAFLVALMGRMEPAEAAAQAAAKAVAAKAAADAVAVTAKPVTALTFSQMVKGSIGKILIGALSVAAIGGGIWAGAKLLDKEQPPIVPIQPTTTVNAVLLSSNTGSPAVATAEDLTEPVVYVTVPATEPEESAAPTEPETSTEPTKPTEPTEPSEPVESTEPSQPAESTEPEEPAFDADREAELDKDSLANVQTAYEAAYSACVAESSSESATLFPVPNAGRDFVVIVKDVPVLSEQANFWSRPSREHQIEDPGVPGNYMAVFCFQKGVSNFPEVYAYFDSSNDPAAFTASFAAVFANGFPEWIAVQLEKVNDNTTAAHLRSAYAAAESARVEEASTDWAVYEKSPDGQTVTVKVTNVAVESERANHWSDLENISSMSFPVPADPGVPGKYSMVFTWQDYELIRVELTDYSDTFTIDLQNANLEERRLEKEDMANLREMYARVQAATLEETTNEPGVTRTGEAHGSYTFTATVEATQTVAGWHSSTDATIDKLVIPAKVKGEFWTIVYDQATETATIS